MVTPGFHRLLLPSLLAAIACLTPGEAEDSGRYVNVEEMDRAAQWTKDSLASECDPAGYTQYKVLALPFTATGTYANPFTGVAMHALIKGPDGAVQKVDGFHDGGAAWKIRYCPLAPGEYTYETISTNPADTGLHGLHGAFTVKPASPDEPNPLYRHGGFLKASSNGRYLTYHDGTPFFWLGDTWWFVPTEDVPYDASSTERFRSMYKLITSLRKEQGFTVVHAAFLGAKNEFGSDQMHDKKVFLKPETWPAGAVDFWRKADRYFLYANHSRIILCIGLLWTWDMDQLKWKAEDVEAAFRYVQARYGSYHILWYGVAEYNAVSPEITNEHIRVGAMIREMDPYKSRPVTLMPWPPYLVKDPARNEPWLGLQLTQGGHFRKPGEVLPRSFHWEAYENKERTLPHIVGEQNFEGIYDKKDDAGDVRAAAYRAMLCGSCGFTYGATGLWYPNRDENHKVDWHWGNNAWFNALDYPGARQMALMRKLFADFEWWSLTPDPQGAVEEGYANEWDIPVISRIPDRLTMAYIPPNLTRTFPVRLRNISVEPGWTFRYFDVRTGEYHESPAPVIVEGAALLPERPSDGDWVWITEKVESSGQ